MNNVQLMGRLIRDVELRHTQGNMMVAEFTVAVDKGLSREKKQQLEQQNKPTADFIRVTAWGKLAENCAKFTAKGKRIIVIGSISTDNYQGSDGKTVYKTYVNANNVEFVDFAGDDVQKKPSKQSFDDDFANDFRAIEDDDDIPF
jgi:single-strand DNA-binding protein